MPEVIKKELCISSYISIECRNFLCVSNLFSIFAGNLKFFIITIILFSDDKGVTDKGFASTGGE
jgi:hypothetical protein